MIIKQVKRTRVLFCACVMATWPLCQTACGGDDNNDDFDTDDNDGGVSDSGADSDSDTDTDTDTDSDSDDECNPPAWSDVFVEGEIVKNFEFNAIYDRDQDGAIEPGELTPQITTLEDILCAGKSSAVFLISERL